MTHLSDEELLARADAATAYAYAPYSHVRVGAALVTEAGNVYRGGNVESVSYGLTICAERAAICVAVAAEGPQMRIAAVAVTSRPLMKCSPCGACRQLISEFTSSATVMYTDGQSVTHTTLNELLPDRFQGRRETAAASMRNDAP